MVIGSRSTSAAEGALDVGRRRRLRERGAAASERRIRPVFLAQLLDLPRHRLPLARLVGEQRLDLGLLLAKRVVLALQLHLLEPAQAAQPRIEDVVDLHLAQLEGFSQNLLWIVLLADDADDLVEVEEHDEHAGEHLEPVLDLAQTVARAAHQHVTAVIEPLAQRLLQRDDLRDHAVDEHVHVHREAGFQLAGAKQLLHHHGRLDRAGLRLDDDAHVLGRFVAHVGDERQLLLGHQLGDLLDQPRFLDHVGDLGDHHLPDAPLPLFLLPARAQTERTAPGAVGLGDRRCRLDDDSAGGKIRPMHELQQVVGLRAFVRDHVERGVAQLGEVVRRDRGGHADRDALRAIGQHVGKGRGQNHRLALGAGVIVAEVDRILVDALQEQARDIGHPRFGVTVCGGPVAVDVAEIALPVDQRIARREVLRQTNQRIVDRLIAVRMVGAHHVADDLRAFLERGAGVEPQHLHAVEDAPVHGL